MTLARRTSTICALLVLALPTGRAEVTGSLPPQVDESSGLAASRRTPGVYWTLNDSGGDAVLHALDARGQTRGSARVAGIKNRDWEDLASFELDGRAWLLIADTGDNAGRRQDCALLVVPEPDATELSPERETIVRVAWSVPVRYLDGPRDVEAVAVDAHAGEVWLLAKRTSPHGLYRLPLRPDPGERDAPAALPVAQVPNAFFPQPDIAGFLLPLPSGRYRAQPTGMDFAPDGAVAAVLSYGDVLIFRRRDGEGWADALTRPPAVTLPHGLPQAEGIAFAPDGRSVLVTSEGAGAPIVRLAVPARITPDP